MLTLHVPDELTPKQADPPFFDPERGEEVDRVLKSRGESLRGQKRLTKIDHMTMKEMVDGYRVRLEKVESFATGFGLSVNYWRQRFGYDPVEPSPDPAADYGRAVKQELEALRRRLDADGLGEWLTSRMAPEGGSSGLTADDARQEIAELERVLRKLQEAQRGIR